MRPAGGCRSTGRRRSKRSNRTRYSGFTAKHFHEHLVQDHKFNWGYTWTKIFLQSKGLLVRAKRRGAHRRKRPRRPLPGMMLHQDGSRHEWLAGHGAMDLIVTMDDATSEIYSAFLVAEEGTASTFRGLLEVFGAHSLSLSLYTDRGSHYFTTPEAGGPVGQQHAGACGNADHLSTAEARTAPSYRHSRLRLALSRCTYVGSDPFSILDDSLQKNCPGTNKGDAGATEGSLLKHLQSAAQDATDAGRPGAHDHACPGYLSSLRDSALLQLGRGDPPQTRRPR